MFYSDKKNYIKEDMKYLASGWWQLADKLPIWVYPWLFLPFVFPVLCLLGFIMHKEASYRFNTCHPSAGIRAAKVKAVNTPGCVYGTQYFGTGRENMLSMSWIINLYQWICQERGYKEVFKEPSSGSLAVLIQTLFKPIVLYEKLRKPIWNR